MSPRTAPPSGEHPWWQGAVIYQIYPRSFLDTTGFGHGDLEGIRRKLDYIESLSVDAIWLSPVTPSPNRDWGYDVSDYCAIHPHYGSMATFKALLEEVHSRGMKLILDQVFSHTSDEHPWFENSVRGGDKADWYVWAPPRPDGTAPNNWLSAFGGPAWSYHPVRQAYYHHKFLKEQPKLNLHNPDARAAVLDVLRFWLDLGVDGFRLDVANTYLHDPQLTDNPPVPEDERSFHHYAHAPRLQRHIHDANRSENAAVLSEIRALADGYDARFVFGEFSEEPELFPLFVHPETGVHSGYTFDFLEDQGLEPETIRAYYDRLAQADAETGSQKSIWPCITFSNHDVVRPVTRFAQRLVGAEGAAKTAEHLMLLLLCLRGTVLLYQGEELGLPEADIPRREDIRDPVGDLYYPYFKGRDGCRTPMPWDASAPYLGFSSVPPWLPPSPEHKGLAVTVQEADPESPLAFARAALALRRESPLLRLGTLESVMVDRFEEPGDPLLLMFVRRWGDQAVRFVFSFEPENAIAMEEPGAVNGIADLAFLAGLRPLLGLGGDPASAPAQDASVPGLAFSVCAMPA